MLEKKKEIEKFKTHPIVLIIKENIFQESEFSYTEVSQSKEIKNFNVKKATTHKNIPLELSKMITAKTLQQLFNQAPNTEEFPSNLKKCRC